jgi:hypothetical protein
MGIFVCLFLCGEASSKIGFVFILTRNRTNGEMQQPKVWERYFESVSKRRYAVATVNWPEMVLLPDYVDHSIQENSGYGDIFYVNAFLQASKVLIEKSQVSGLVLLSGACMPVRCFDDFYFRVHPVLALGRSILYELKTNVSDHLMRFDLVQGSRIRNESWSFHNAQGMVLHSNLIKYLLADMNNLVRELRSVNNVDEHYVTYSLLAGIESNQTHRAEVRFAQKHYYTLNRESLVYIDWSRKNDTSPYTWNTTVTDEVVAEARSTGKFFMRKVSRDCIVSPAVAKCHLSHYLPYHQPAVPPRRYRQT